MSTIGPGDVKAALAPIWRKKHPIEIKAPLVSSRCRGWLMLTLVRGEAGTGARVAEVEGRVWTVPAARLKGGKAMRGTSWCRCPMRRWRRSRMPALGGTTFRSRG